MKAALLALALLAMPAHAHDWTAPEKGWAAAWLATRAVDWAQTRHIARNPDRFRELNPLIGRHPSLGEVNRHFIVSIGAGYVVHNIGIGVRFQF